MPIINKSRPEGNAHAILGAVQDLFRQTGRLDEWPEIEKRMTSGNYDNLCAVAEEVSNGVFKFYDPNEDDDF